MSILKKAFIFSAELPSKDALEKHLAEYPYREVNPTESFHAGFIPHPVTTELVTPMTGTVNGYIIAMQIDEKVMPPAAIRREVAKQADAFEKREGKAPARADLGDIRAAVELALCQKAPITTQTVYAFYCADSNHLMVINAKKPHANTLMKLLVLAVGSLKSTTIHISDIKNGISTRLKNWLNGDDEAFGALQVADHVKLVNPETKEDQTLNVDDLRDEDLGLETSLADGYVVEHIAFRFSEDIYFKLNHRFEFSSMRLLGDIEQEEDDKAYNWRNEATISALSLDKVVNELCALLEYKEDDEAKAA